MSGQADSSGAESRGASAPTDQPPAPPEQQNRRIQLFWNILYGVQHEAVYARDRNALLQLRKEFSVADADKQVGGAIRGTWEANRFESDSGIPLDEQRNYG